MIARMTMGNETNYSIQVTNKAVFIKGNIPISDFSELTSFCEKKGFTIMDPGLASAYEVTAVITSEDGSEYLRNELDKSLSDYDKDVAWIKGWDTGISSKTLYYFFHDNDIWDHADAPRDADDFGRCYRLMKKFPEWDIKKAKAIPRWEELVDRWTELVDLYEQKKYDEVYVILSHHELLEGK